METMSFLAACIEFFGLFEGQSKLDFGKEIKKLTNEDRKEIADDLTKNGYSINPDTIIPKAV